MKNHIVDITLGAETVTGVHASLNSLTTEISAFAASLDETQRKHSLRIGTRNETFCREMMEFARERPELVPTGIDGAALQRDLLARDQLTPVLFRLQALTRMVEDTHVALGVDVYNGSRAMYKAVKPLALINGVADIIVRIGQRFANQGARRKSDPKTKSPDSSTL